MNRPNFDPNFDCVCEGRRCRIVSHGVLNNVLVEFQDGTSLLTSRHKVKKDEALEAIASLERKIAYLERRLSLAIGMLDDRDLLRGYEAMWEEDEHEARAQAVEP